MSLECNIKVVHLPEINSQLLITKAKNRASKNVSKLNSYCKETGFYKVNNMIYISIDYFIYVMRST
jgi:hypothetical protein